ncbi:MAG TPA: prolyl oligopeptidase family serine peptidase [Ignavibacteria bacterium]|nr:prolyl oligopeptidase family serine peptidase [Ignavibacteria bacterium]
MKNFFSVLGLILIFSIQSNVQAQWSYPVSKTVDSSNTYYGETISDPYQWIEDLKSDEVKNWFRSQANYTDDVISKIPNRETLAGEMSELDKVKKVKYSSIAERNGIYFYEKRLPGEEISKLYSRKISTGEETLLFDPETYESGKKYTMGSWIISDNTKKLILAITENGKERPFLRIMNMENKTFYPDKIDAAYASGWLEGSDDTFMYLKLQSDDVHKLESNLNSKVMIHKIGEDLSKDKLILSREHDPGLDIKPEEYPYIAWYEFSDYIFAGKGSVDNNQELYYAPKSELLSGKINWKPLCKKNDEITYFIAHGDKVYLLSSKDASNFKVISTSLNKPDLANANLIMKGGDKKIESIGNTKDFLIITQIYNGIETTISKMNFENRVLTPVNLPLKGSISVDPVSPFSNQCYVWNSYWTTPSNLYSLNLENDEFQKGPFNVEFEFSGIENIVSEEIEVPSHDGAMVPLSIIYDKTKIKKDGSNICYLDGYGAYGYSSNPYFNTFMLPMLSRGVIYAVAHVRGGGERGEDWYKAGWKTTKPNTWKDFIACGEYLIDNGYTSKEKLAGTGTSAGGILIGRAITERPDLFKVAIPQVGCLNTVRAELSPNGPVNIPEFGTVEIEEEYRALKEMDSYLHLTPGVKYPATLITTGFNDPRVISWIPGKFAAKMQNISSSDNPVLLKVDYSTGHFGGETMSDYFKNLSDIYSFIMWQCGDPDFQPKAN